MFSAVKLGLRELANHFRMSFIMALVVAIALLSYLVLQGYQTGLQADFPRLNGSYLVILQTGSLGELYGSRLSPKIGAELLVTGENLVIPEIHTVVGTSVEDAVFLRGVPLESYTRVEDFHVIAGRPLQAGDAPRLAMVGAKLAETRNIVPGDAISLRGRDFKVVGIFQMDTYIDDEAWISLEDAQNLLGWGEDVSFYIISDQGALHEGDHLPGGVSVTRRGETGDQIVKEWQPLFDLLEVVTNTLAVAASIALANILWRLAWLRRHDLAILRSVGFGQFSLVGYLAIQGIATTTVGYVLGLLGAFILMAITNIKTAGFTLSPVYSIKVILGSAGLAGLIALVGALVPAWWLSRFNLSSLLRIE
jgi:putative ABC transport system permease protein